MLAMHSKTDRNFIEAVNVVCITEGDVKPWRGPFQ